MHKIRSIAQYEIIATITRRSFLFATVFVPLVIIGSLGLMIFTVDRDSQSAQRSTPVAEAANSERSLDSFDRSVDAAGYVDLAGIITTLPSDIAANRLRAYPDETSAQAAIERGDITGYYLIPENYIAAGELIYIDPDFNASRVDEQAGLMRWALFVNLSGGDTALARRALTPMDVTMRPLNPAPATAEPAGQEDCLRPGFSCESNPFVRYLPSIIMMVLYMSILMSSSLLLNSVGEEKKNRLMESLLVSVNTRQLLIGKIIGLGITALIQFLIWAALGYAAFRLGAPAINLPAGFALPPQLVFWCALYILLGFAMYASLMAGIGALAPNIHEVSWATIVIIAPLFAPYFPVYEIIDDVLHLDGRLNNAVDLFLSIFPLSAPTAMIQRLAGENVPLWQPVLASVLMVIAAVLIVRAVARMFRTQSLLSGQPFSFKRYFSILLSRA